MHHNQGLLVVAPGKRKKSSRKAAKEASPAGGKSVEVPKETVDKAVEKPKQEPSPPVEVQKITVEKKTDPVDEKTLVFVSKNAGSVSCLAGVITAEESRRRGGLFPRDFPGGVKTVEDMLAAGRLTR